MTRHEPPPPPPPPPPVEVERQGDDVVAAIAYVLVVTGPAAIGFLIGWAAFHP